MSRNIMKKASWGASLKNVGIATGLGAGLALGASGIDAAIGAIQSARERSKMEPLFREMLNVHPNLRKYPEDRVRLYYNQVWNFSPAIAKSPVTAGSYIWNAMQFDHMGGPGIPAVKELADTQKSVMQGLETSRKIRSHMDSATGYAGAIMNARNDVMSDADLAQKSYDLRKQELDWRKQQSRS